MKKLLIVDDHRLFLDGMSHLLKQLDDDIEVCASRSGLDAIARLDRGERFALALIDLSMPGVDGFAFLLSLKERRIACPVVVVSASVSHEDVRRALRCGALGFIPKCVSSAEMLRGIRTVLSGSVYLPDDLWLCVGDEPRGGTAPAMECDKAASGIGERQIEVLGLMTRGMSNRQIASVLAVSEATVKYHISILFRSLKVGSRTACVREARRRQLTPPDVS